MIIELTTLAAYIGAYVVSCMIVYVVLSTLWVRIYRPAMRFGNHERINYRKWDEKRFRRYYHTRWSQAEAVKFASVWAVIWPLGVAFSPVLGIYVTGRMGIAWLMRLAALWANRLRLPKEIDREIEHYDKYDVSSHRTGWVMVHAPPELFINLRRLPERIMAHDPVVARAEAELDKELADLRLENQFTHLERT